jgi:hypothetical protein
MTSHYLCAGIALVVALCASSAYAGDPLIDLHVTIGAFQADTDTAGAFAVTGLKAGKYDVILTGNPIKQFLDRDGGAHISLKFNGKRFPLACSQDGCKAKAVPIQAGAKGIVTLT